MPIFYGLHSVTLKTCNTFSSFELKPCLSSAFRSLSLCGWHRLLEERPGKPSHPDLYNQEPMFCHFFVFLAERKFLAGRKWGTSYALLWRGLNKRWKIHCRESDSVLSYLKAASRRMVKMSWKKPPRCLYWQKRGYVSWWKELRSLRPAVAGSWFSVNSVLCVG